MKIIVCVKVVKGEINPFDESALECALKLSTDVTVVSMGPENTKSVLKPLTRLGVKVILISDRMYAGSDTLATSYILSQAVEKMDYDLIVCGRQSVDGDTAQVGPMLSAFLDIPVVTNVLKADYKDNFLNLETRDGARKNKLPALITVERSCILRFPSIFSKENEIEIINNELLKCEEQRCGLKGSPTRVIETFENISGKRKCKFITMDELPPLLENLKNKDNKICKNETSYKKLPTVWAIGKKVFEKAKDISEKPVLIEEDGANEIINKARAEKPEIILFNADFNGRKNAPIVAAKLNTGLCADCTCLETDGKELYMIRPAGGGNITAKIKCLTYPKMATVRTDSENSDIIVAGGKGVSSKIDKLYEFAKKLNAQIASSRGLVDMNLMTYEAQIGLTGKMVSPKIYIAVGISGAVHHTCAIEGAGTIIAINPDKNARIFEYADYGIIEEF